MKFVNIYYIAADVCTEKLQLSHLYAGGDSSHDL